MYPCPSTEANGICYESPIASHPGNRRPVGLRNSDYTYPILCDVKVGSRQATRAPGGGGGLDLWGLLGTTISPSFPCTIVGIVSQFIAWRHVCLMYIRTFVSQRFAWVWLLCYSDCHG